MLKEYFTHMDGGDQAFTIEAPKIKFGTGALIEAGADATFLGLKKVVVFSDPRVAVMEATERLLSSLSKAGVEAVLYDACEVEPTDASFVAAGQFMAEGGFDGVFSIGGGSVIDTAKAANLLSTYPDDLMVYVNAPIGQAKPVPGPLKPHIACPTTFGTASECTGIAICDFPSLGAKSGISHPYLRPVMGIIDPLNLKTLPKNVLAANGFDVFSHAVESVTARPFTHRPAPETPDKRPLSQGANPYSDLSCLEAIRFIGMHLVDAVNNPTDEGYEAMAMAGMLAGIGFGNAGCHLPHGMSYAVAGLSHDYVAEGWPGNHPMVPHGISVIVNAPAVFRFTGKACPERHFKAAEAMGADMSVATLENAGQILADRVIDMMRDTGMPNGVSAVGYDESDIDALTERAFMQKRLSDNAPLPVSKEDMRALFVDAMRYW